MAKKKSSDKKGKKVATKKPCKKANEYYQVSGDKVERKNKSCPKCGQGNFMAKHKDRLVCGKCQYVEFIKE
jgi:ubiquitin-small subunit ribosomal protein S27Ae